MPLGRLRRELAEFFRGGLPVPPPEDAELHMDAASNADSNEEPPAEDPRVPNSHAAGPSNTGAEVPPRRPFEVVGDPTPPPVPPPAGIGTTLRETRERRGITIDEAERDTRIGARYLEAIEAARFETLPAPVYARGFVRSYARYLGLDPEWAVAQVPKDLPRPAGLEPLPGLRGSGERPVLPSVEPRWIAFGAIGVVVLVAGWLLLSLFDGDEATVAGPAVDTPAASATPEPSAAAGETLPAPTVPPFDPGRMPDFSGVELSEAERILGQQSLSSVVIELADEVTPAGRIIGQSPDPGVEIEAGASVTLVVSSGPP